MYLLGFQKWNKPSYINQNNNAGISIQKVVYSVVESNNKAEDMRQTYLKARAKWFYKQGQRIISHI